MDAKDYARNQINTLEERLGHKVTCVMNIHRDTDNVHINVTIAGKIPDWHLREKQPEQERAHNSEDIDLSKVAEKDRLEGTDGKIYTKHHPLNELSRFEEWLWADVERWIDKEEFIKLRHWIQAKEKRGEDAFGKAPLREKQIDLSRIPKEDRLETKEQTITKYDSLERLEEFNRQTNSDYRSKLQKEEQDRLNEWIETKQEQGDDAYGEPPMKYREEQDRGRERKPHEVFGKVTLDLSKVPEDERIYVDGRLYTKYNSSESLKGVKNQCFENEENRLPQDKYEMLKSWIDNKQEHGEDVYGYPPMRELTADEARERSEKLEERLKTSQDDERGKENYYDKIARELTGGKTVSPQVVAIDRVLARAEKMIEREERQQALKTSWNNQGDVYIDKKTLDGMRNEGNYYVHARVHTERELEKAIERELGTRDERERERKEREPDRSLTEREDTKDQNRRTTEDSTLGRTRRDDSRMEEERESRDDDEKRRGRRRDDESGRGR